MNIKAMSVSLAMLLGVGGLALGQASAAPVSGSLSSQFEVSNSQVQLVDHRRHRRFFRNNLWWTIPFIATAPLYANRYYDDGYGYRGYGGGHVEWCLNRYRSYDPDSDTFMGYDGRRHRCNSPY